jgi:hypothetical protein
MTGGPDRQMGRRAERNANPVLVAQCDAVAVSLQASSFEPIAQSYRGYRGAAPG